MCNASPLFYIFYLIIVHFHGQIYHCIEVKRRTVINCINFKPFWRWLGKTFYHLSLSLSLYIYIYKYIYNGLTPTCREPICKNLKPLTKKLLINLLPNNWCFSLLPEIAKVYSTVLIEYSALKVNFNQKVV